MKKQISIYLASPFFNQEQSDREIRVSQKLKSLGYNVIRPREFGVLAPNATEEERQYIVKKDIEAIDSSDLLFCITNDKDMGCFTSDTKIRIVRNDSLSNDDSDVKFTNVPIRDISKNTLVQSYDVKVQSPTVGVSLGSVMTRDLAMISELYLDTGEVIRCTQDHPFLTDDNTYKLLMELKPGTKLKCYDDSFKTVSKINPDVSMETVYGMKVLTFHNYVLESGLVVKNSMIEYGYSIAKNKPRVIFAEGFNGKVNVMLSATALAVLTSTEEITNDVIDKAAQGIKVNTYTGSVE